MTLSAAACDSRKPPDGRFGGGVERAAWAKKSRREREARCRRDKGREREVKWGGRGKKSRQTGNASVRKMVSPRLPREFPSR